MAVHAILLESTYLSVWATCSAIVCMSASANFLHNWMPKVFHSLSTISSAPRAEHADSPQLCAPGASRRCVAKSEPVTSALTIATLPLRLHFASRSVPHQCPRSTSTFVHHECHNMISELRSSVLKTRLAGSPSHDNVVSRSARPQEPTFRVDLPVPTLERKTQPCVHAL